jgi:5-methyltetrahydrofolate--homocysteine methyltransferase
MEKLIQGIRDGILEGLHREMEGRVQAAIEAGIEPRSILDQGMVAAMGEVGRLFEAGEYYVPEMLVAARAMQAGLAVLKPHLQQAGIRSAGRVAIGTVKGDLHDIGKNLVAMMLEGAGFEVLDLGTDVPPERFAEAARDVDVIALSALLTTTMPMMAAVIEQLQARGLRQKVRVIVGGAPVTAAFAEGIGADGHAPDASRAVALTRSLLEA